MDKAISTTAVGGGVAVGQWWPLFEQVTERIAGRFRRVESHATARAFVAGLLSAVERKNCWWLAEQAGHHSPRRMQRPLGEAVWDAELVRDDVRAFVVEELADPDAVLICDETGFVKKGQAPLLCWTPEPVPLAALVRVAGARWAVEETFQIGKGQVGLDRYQRRTGPPGTDSPSLRWLPSQSLLRSRQPSHHQLRAWPR